MIRLRAVAIVLVCVPVLLGDGPPSAQSRSSKTWVGRHQEIENYLRLADCVSMKWFAPNYAARCTLNPGGPIAAMAWRSVVPGPPGAVGGYDLVAPQLPGSDPALRTGRRPRTVTRRGSDQEQGDGSKKGCAHPGIIDQGPGSGIGDQGSGISGRPSRHAAAASRRARPGRREWR